MKKHGFVYCITSQDSGLTKVGFSYDPEKRLKQLQTGHGSKLRMPLKIRSKNPRALEARLHLVFNHKRQAGEWFRLDQEDFDLITREFSDASLGETIASAIRDCFISPNVCDSNFEPANIVDVMQNVAKALDGIRHQNEVISRRIYDSAVLIAGALARPVTQAENHTLQPEKVVTPPLALIQEFDGVWNSFLDHCGMMLSAALCSAKPYLVEPFPADSQDQAYVLLVFPHKAAKDFEFVKKKCITFIDHPLGISSRRWWFDFKLDEPVGKTLSELLVQNKNDPEACLEILNRITKSSGGANL